LLWEVRGNADFSHIYGADTSLTAIEKNLHEHIAFVQRSTPGMTVLDRADLLVVDSVIPQTRATRWLALGCKSLTSIVE
jgi:hypothetical protein